MAVVRPTQGKADSGQEPDALGLERLLESSKALLRKGNGGFCQKIVSSSWSWAETPLGRRPK